MKVLATIVAVAAVLPAAFAYPQMARRQHQWANSTVSDDTTSSNSTVTIDSGTNSTSTSTSTSDGTTDGTTTGTATTTTTTISISAPLSTATSVSVSGTSSGSCTPGTYQCNTNLSGWNVCDVSSTWVNGGSCAPTEMCYFNTFNGSPYCLPH